MTKNTMTTTEALKIMDDADIIASELFLDDGGVAVTELIERRSLDDDETTPEWTVMGLRMYAWGVYFLQMPTDDVLKVMRACEVLGVRTPAERDWEPAGQDDRSPDDAHERPVAS